MKRRIISKGARTLPVAHRRGNCAKIGHAVVAVVIATAFSPIASAQIASLDKGHQLLVNNGLQIWGLNTDSFQYNFNYNNLTGANMNAVMWSYNQSNAGVFRRGRNGASGRIIWAVLRRH